MLPPAPRRRLVPWLLGAVAFGLAVAAARVPARNTGAGAPRPITVQSASLSTIHANIRAPGARAVLVNVWATWCDPCREELPDLLRFYRDNRARGLRLIMISADDDDRRQEVATVLATAAAQAGLGASADDIRSFIKHDDDMKFIEGIDPRWSGALPATFLYDGRGQRKRSWLAPVTARDLETGVGDRLTNGASGDKTGDVRTPDPAPRTANKIDPQPRREP
jgi:thiol-disulfide isomerase/thioredoxin